MPTRSRRRPRPAPASRLPRPSRLPPLSPEAQAEIERLAAVGEVTASAVHEIRNALQVAATSLWLAKQAKTEELTQQHVAKAERATRTAQGVVDAVLGLARGERLVGESATVDELLAEARSDLGASSRDVRWSDEGGDVRLRGSPVLLSRVFHVLFENAVAIAGGTVRIATRARTEPNGVRIDVADDGPGVPAKLRETIFRPLVTGREGGTGLGLSLAKRIVEAHGGTMRLAVKGEAALLAGAHFVIELPPS